MSYYDYKQSVYIELKQYPFYAIIMAAMRQADTPNLAMLESCWPETWAELQARYNAPDGLLPGEERPKATCGSLMSEEDKIALGIGNWDPKCSMEPDHEGDHRVSQEGLVWSRDNDGS